ncbi:uncharacterized protein EAF01_003014 [Botrytis porri]|uniref:Uncharacterized protein n=1 Tax=Botrytis porri TaxID=87229 RepID=A0A4Z1KQE5_9HELO|nr:uncharacterized protein EAF01_003014 [Botrytis porri]KAF7909296.1 hypothetical protein EAF01_003014 [Botrytis porri]TGO86742.1 hypothetical protein BPOR_0280g00110 [Botrytis porri]
MLKDLANDSCSERTHQIGIFASSTGDHVEPQSAAIPVSNVAIEKGICEEEDVEESDVKIDIEENDGEEIVVEESDVEIDGEKSMLSRNDLDLNFAKVLESVNNREEDISQTTKSRSHPVSEIPSSIDFEEREEPGSPESVTCLITLIETDDTNLLPIGNRTSGEEIDSASTTSEGEELTTSEGEYPCEKIELREEGMVRSGDSTYRSTSPTIIGLDDLIEIDSKALDTKEEAALDFQSEGSSTTESSTCDGIPETLKIQSLGRWMVPKSCDTSNLLFESPKLIPERRESQLFLVPAEDEKVGDKDADEDKSSEVKTPENFIEEEPKSINDAEDESTELGKHDGSEISLNDGSIGVDDDDNDQANEKENYKSHDVDDEGGVKVDNNDGGKATEGGCIREKTDENESVEDTETDEATSEIKDIIRQMCEEYTAWTAVTTHKTAEAANNESIADIIKKLCVGFACVEVTIDETPQAEIEKAIDVDDIAYHEAQEAKGEDVNDTDMAKEESIIEVKNKDYSLEHKVEDNRIMDENTDVHDDMTAEIKVEKSVEVSINETNDMESDQPLTRENESADELIDWDSTVKKVQEDGSSLGNEGGYITGGSLLWLRSLVRRLQQQGKSNDPEVQLEVQLEVQSEEKNSLVLEDDINEVQPEVQSEEKKALQLEEDDIDEVQVVSTEFAYD